MRVQRSGSARLVCRIGSKRVTAPGRQAGALQIAADRWLLTRNRAGESERLAVLDTKAARTVTSAVVRAGAKTTLLADGTLAWLPGGGPLEVQTPAATTPTVLADATDAPSALVSSASTIYWTAGGAPQRFIVSSPG